MTAQDNCDDDFIQLQLKAEADKTFPTNFLRVKKLNKLTTLKRIKHRLFI